MLNRAWATVRAVASTAAALGVAGVCYLGLVGVTSGRDLGQWDPNDPVTQWFAALMQPDNPKASCCGEADAYWADEVHVEPDGFGGQKVVAVITDTREDGPLKRIHEDVGTRYVVPPNKITRKDGNPTGHVIIFLGANQWHGEDRIRDVVCYVMKGGV